jgi:predicted nuclease of predicted toxin-antitoxin system
LKLLLDEMYSATLADGLGATGIEAATVVALGLTGRSDPEIFAAALASSHTILTENVADFTRISAEHLTAGRHHPGVLIALSSRFSRRPAGANTLIAAIRSVADEQFQDRVVYLEAAKPE